MHKGITLLVLGAIFCAMGIIFYTDISNNPAEVALANKTQSDNANAALESLAVESLQEAVKTQNTTTVQSLTVSPAPNAGEVLPFVQSQEPSIRATSDRFISVAPPATAPSATVPPATVPVAPLATLQEVAPPSSKAPLSQFAGQENASKTNGIEAKKTSSSTQEQAVVSSTKIDESKLSRTAKHSLNDISLAMSAQGMVLRIRASSSFPVSTFSLKEPHRLVIDLPGTWQNMHIPEVPHGSVITSIRLGTHKTGPRLVLDLVKEVTFERSRPDAHSVDILIK